MSCNGGFEKRGGVELGAASAETEPRYIAEVIREDG